MSTSVCIIGAGPAGIVAAKTLLHDSPKGAFDVTVFEQANRIGGLWPLAEGDGGLVNPLMPTNLSRHTVSFSDLAWPESSPTFPKAWQVGQYLKRYAETFDLQIQTSCKVISAIRSAEDDNSKRWKIQIQRGDLEDCRAPGSREASSSTSTSCSSSSETHYFHKVIVASGFFGKPIAPSSLLSIGKNAPIIRHSSQFRRIKDVIGSTEVSSSDKATNILVIGGSFSGAETAASIASQLSSEMHSPGAPGIVDATKYHVYHVVQRPFWVMPYHLPVNAMGDPASDGSKSYNPAPEFLPLDLAMYNMAHRPPGPIINKSGVISEKAAEISNGFFETLIGGDQSDLRFGNNDASHASNALQVVGDLRRQAPWMAISDSYAQFVRSGQITPIIGRFDGLNESTSAIISSHTSNRNIDDIAAIILATGFDPAPSLSFLPEDILSTISYDPSTPFPLGLSCHSTVHPSVPDLGFVGFYRGPYWGVMESQSRFLAALFLDSPSALATLSSPSPIPALRTAFHANRSQLAQFPMGDYPYLMESLRTSLSGPLIGDIHAGPMLPSRYPPANASPSQRQESETALAIVGRVLAASSTQHRFVPRAIFTAWQGTWQLRRKLISADTSYPSGTFLGSASFHPRAPTGPCDAEYLYIEEGDFTTSSGMTFRANRRYAHRYSEADDKLSVWFVKADNKTVDYLFHELEILDPAGKGKGWRARAHHLCIKDTYDVEYEFCFRGAALRRWSMAYQVRGPKKDYRIESVYER